MTDSEQTFSMYLDKGKRLKYLFLTFSPVYVLSTILYVAPVSTVLEQHEGLSRVLALLSLALVCVLSYFFVFKKIIILMSTAALLRTPM